MSLSLSRLVCLVPLLVLLVGGRASAQSSYDTFPGPFIDQAKWFGVELSEGDGANLEAVRQIVNGQLSLTNRARGGTTSDSDSHLGTTSLLFRDPRGISQIVFDAKAPTVTVNGCSANLDDTFSGIQAIASFYREDTYHGSGGDVIAFIQMGRITGLTTPSNRLELFGVVVSRDGSDDEIGIGFVDLGTVLRENTVRLSIEWDPATDEIKFRVNQRPVEVIQGPESIDFPDENIKGILAGNFVENCNAQSTLGYTKATIDNVSIKRLQ